MREPSEDYLRALRESREHHASNKTFSGKFLRPHGLAIKNLIQKHGVKSVLDYGCQMPDTPVLTPTGWRKIGEISEGDWLIGSDGKPTLVIGIHSPGYVPVYKVRFNDGTDLTVDGNHLWNVRTINHQNRGQSFVTMKTVDLYKDHRWGRDGHAAKWRIPMVEPVQFDGGRSRGIDPYLMGLLIGDGSLKNSPRLYAENDRVVEEAVAALPYGMVMSEMDRPDGGRSYGLNQPGGSRWLQNPIKVEMKRVGLQGLSGWNKFIPPDYLMCPVQDRISLLQGLIDSDGEIGDYQLSYSTASERLADDVAFLVQSLGGIATRGYRERPSFVVNGERRFGRPSHRIGITLPKDIVPTRAKAWRNRQKYHPNRVITSIEEAGSAEVVGVSVSAANQLYVTENFIVTHNCGKGEQYRWVNPENGLTLEQDWGVKVTKYDPAWPPYAAEPVGQFDLVLCTHTLGSIPTKDLSWVIAKIYGLTKKVVYFAEKLGPVRKTLLSRPDLHPVGWKASDWIEVLEAGRPRRLTAWLSCRCRAASGEVIVRRFLLGSGNYEDADRMP